MKYRFLYLGLILSFSLSASEINKQIENIEKLAKEKIEKLNLSDREKFYVNLMAGREFYHYHLFDKSKEYYGKAELIDVKENKLEIYVNLIAIELISKNSSNVENRLNKLQEYLKLNPNLKSDELSQYVEVVKASLKSPTDQKAIPAFYGNYVANIKFKDLIKEKKYSEAFSYLNLDNVKNSNNVILQMNYDLLNVLNNKQTVKKLLCTESLIKYPNSVSYSLMVCDVLRSYLKIKKLDNKKLLKLENYFSKIDQDKVYYLSALKDLEN